MKQDGQGEAVGEMSKKCPFCGSDQVKGNLCTYCGREIDRKPRGSGKTIAVVITSFIVIGVIAMVMALKERKLAASEMVANESSCKKAGVSAPDLLSSCSQSRYNAEIIIKRQTQRDCEGAGIKELDTKRFTLCMENPPETIKNYDSGTLSDYILGKESEGIVAWKSPISDDLKPDFHGTRINVLVNILSESKVPKRDEFDTDASYSNKVAAISSIPVGIYGRGDIFVFNDSTLFQMEYDANKSGYVLNISENPIIASGTYKGPSYVGQNAYGVTRQVSSEVVHNYLLKFSNFSNLKKGYLYSGHTSYMRNNYYFLPYNPDEAKRDKDSFELLYLVRLTVPYIIYNEINVEPTIDLPRQTTYVTETVTGSLLEVWIYNEKTGKVLARVPAD